MSAAPRRWYSVSVFGGEGQVREVAVQASSLEEATERALASVGSGAIARCQRCSSLLTVSGHCDDETCPFSDHLPNCPVGWSGHPEREVGGSCTCQ